MTKTDIIHTAYHKLERSAMSSAVLQKMDMAAKYFVADDVVALLERSDAMKSVKALVDAKVLRLPYSPILFEYSTPSHDFRWFILLEEVEFGFAAYPSYIHHKTGVTGHHKDKITVFLTNNEFMATNCDDRPTAHACIAAICMALLFLNVSGITKEVVEPHKFNAARVKSHKPTVPRVTTIRIGHVYNKDGEAVPYGAKGGKRRVHMRAGHTRNQHYGPQNSLTKIVYIAPILVNYNPGDDKPEMPQKRIKL